MKNFFISAAILVSSLSSYSYVLEAKPIADMINAIQKASFEHKEDGLAFGFFTIKSCLYVSQDFAILKNYCVPKKDYPAAGYTIISPEFGIIYLYQEKIGSLLQRDIEISTFSDILREHISGTMDGSTIAGLNQVLEKLYYQYGPGCWSTNLSSYTEKPEVSCTTTDVLNFKNWADETQIITGDEKNWQSLLKAIESSIDK